MKRAIPRSVLEQMTARRREADAETDAQNTDQKEAQAPSPTSRTGGSGGAWKAGAMAQVEGDLARLRSDQAAAILAGARVLELDPATIDDPLGSDRRPDWAETESFEALKDSIRANGQDMPIQVWPADPDWQPDPRTPDQPGTARFRLLSGRRRRAACAALGRPVRAVIVPIPDGASDADTRFTMLFHRFRENEAREDLSPFERLTSIGEIYEALTEAEEGAPTAVAFAKRIGVHESIVSRARAVWRHRDSIRERISDPYSLTFKALQALLAEIDGRTPKAPAPSPKRAPVSASLTSGGRTLTAKAKGSTITVQAGDIEIDAATLNAVLKKIATALPTASAKKSKGKATP